ncbi:MAG: hypothetical protein GF353_06535 [Candidatus Lokiarchaeota archaeon]|nr:hypothetical protein [Candidatus Lokiarchaeota archaeon]
MSVKLKLHYEPPFSMLFEKSNEILEFEDELQLKDLLDKFSEEYGDKFKELVWDKKKQDELNSMLSIIINGNSYRDDDFLDKKLKDGDDISFIYIFFGG